MNPVCSLLCVPRTIQLTNQTVCNFYQNNPGISPDEINLLLVQMLELNSLHPNTTAAPSKTANHSQIADLKESLDKVKQSASEINRRISSEMFQNKTRFLNEFRSIVDQSDMSNKRDLCLANNAEFIHSIERTTHDIRNIKGINNSVGEKVSFIIKQFQKIIHTNTESILSKTNDTPGIVADFVQNFELNLAHMIQTIQQHMLDYVAAKEAASKTVLDALSENNESGKSVYSRLMYEIADFLHNIRSIPETASSPTLESILARMFTTSEIQKDDKHNVVLSRVSHSDVFIQQHQLSDRNVNTDELKTFTQNANGRNAHGILISQYTGITSKPHFCIEINNNRVFVYVHCMEYSSEKLQTAIEIVDTIDTKLSEFNVSSDQKFNIPKDVLDEINREYQIFIHQKESILTTVKDSYKKILTQIEELRFASLDKFLSTRYSSCKKQGYVCNLCNTFTVSTLKGLAAHKRGCMRKVSGSSFIPTATATTIVKSPPIVCDKVAQPVQ